MSFTRFRRQNKSKSVSAECREEAQDYINKNDPQIAASKSPLNQDLNNLPNLKEDKPLENLQKDFSTSSNSSESGQFICDNCINQALIYSKGLNKNNSIKPGENPMDIQERLNQLRQQQIYDKVRERQKQTDFVSKDFLKPTNKEILQQNNENGVFWKNADDDPMKIKVLEKYNRIDALNAMKKKIGNSVDDYYRNYVDNYKPDTKEVDFDEIKRNMQKQYNKDLDEQIRQNQKLKNKLAAEQKTSNYPDDNRTEQELQEELLRKQKNSEINKANEELIEQRRKKRQNDKLQDAYDAKQNNENSLKKFNDEIEKQRNLLEQRKRDWQKSLQEQIEEKQRRKLAEKERDKKIQNVNEFAHENRCECVENGVCCCCNRVYPMINLNPRKKYAGLARIQKQRRKRLEQEYNAEV